MSDITLLQAQVTELQERVRHLESIVLHMGIGKLDNPKYPYINWVVSMNLSEEKTGLIQTIFGMLREKRREPDCSLKRLPGIPEKFYQMEQPNFQAVSEVLAEVLKVKLRHTGDAPMYIDIHPGHVIDLLKALCEEGRFVEIIEPLLEEAGIEV